MDTFSHSPGTGSGSSSNHTSSPDYDTGYSGGSCTLFSHRIRHELPRITMRPYRQDNDEPAEMTLFVRETRRSICQDGRDRTKCSQCRHGVLALPPPAAADSNSAKSRRPTMSPQRVFRALVMADAGEPLRPAVRDALLDAFARSTATKTIKTAKTARAKKADGPTFHQFTRLPFEIRRMVWAAALPARVLLRDDLCAVSYRSIRKAFRPADHVHTIEELWQSDLFHVCTEARRVVMAHTRDMATAALAMDSGAMPSAAIDPDAPLVPLVMNATTRSKLASGLDVLYYPWLGTKRALERGGGSPIAHDAPLPHMELSASMSALHIQPPSGESSSSSNSNSGGSSDSDSASSAAAAGFGTRASGIHGRYPAKMTKQKVSHQQKVSRLQPPASVAQYPVSTMPYGHWASQLRLLAVPSATVALDAAWIDKQHPDTLAWAVGVDLSEPADDGHVPLAKPAPACLRVVVADIAIPVFINLAECASDAQRQLLQQNIFAHPGAAAGYSNGQVTEASLALQDRQDRHVNLNGKDYAVLVDLYDDARIDELCTLAQTAARPGRCTRDGHVVNRAALHRCIECTRRAWEARSSDASATAWQRTLGTRVGAHLQKICRPTILVSLVLAFDTALGV